MLSGAIYPAHELMADAGYDVDWSDYIGSIMNYYASSDGKLYSFPFNSSTPVMYYNIDMYKQAGIEGPAETWEQFEANLRTLKAAGIACPIAFSTYLWVHLEQYSYMHGEPIATQNNGFDGLDAELVFNRTSYVKHVERLKRWYDDKLGSYAKELFGVGTRESFATGKCGHYFGSIASHGTVLKSAKMHVECRPPAAQRGCRAQQHCGRRCELLDHEGLRTGRVQGRGRILRLHPIDRVAGVLEHGHRLRADDQERLRRPRRQGVLPAARSTPGGRSQSKA